MINYLFLLKRMADTQPPPVPGPVPGLRPRKLDPRKIHGMDAPFPPPALSAAAPPLPPPDQVFPSEFPFTAPIAFPEVTPLLPSKFAAETREKMRRLRNIEERESKLPDYVVDGVAYMPFYVGDFVREDIGVVTIIQPPPGTTSMTGREIKGLLDDAKMGPSCDPGSVCQTCGRARGECPGHFGYCHFPDDIFLLHPLFASAAADILSCICYRSVFEFHAPHLVINHGLALTEAHPEILSSHGERRWEIIRNRSECEMCKFLKVPPTKGKYSYPVYQYSLETGRGGGTAEIEKKEVEVEEREEILEERRKKEAEELIRTKKKKKDRFQTMRKSLGKEATAIPESECYQIFEAFDKASDEDRKFMLDILDISHDINLRGYIMRGVVVIPPPYRGKTFFDAKKQTSSIASIYPSIIKNIFDLRDPSRSEKDRKDNLKTLRMGLTNLFYNAIISSGMSGKKALIRGSLNATRCNFTARSTATLDAQLPPDVVAIGDAIARKLTSIDEVTLENKAKMEGMVREGLIRYYFPKNNPHVRHLIRRQDAPSFHFTIGDVVERLIQNGDIVLLNRQPTIHSRGIVGFRVIIVPGKSVRVGMAITHALHLDYDGDEVNIHVPQTPQAKLEAMTTANIRQCVMDPHGGGTIMGLFFELLDAIVLLTDDATRVPWDIFTSCIHLGLEQDIDLAAFEARLKSVNTPIDDYQQNVGTSGKILFSTILPDGLDYTRENIVIQNGILKKGVLNNADVGANGELNFQIVTQFGSDRFFRFLNEGNRILLAWYDHNPQSFGIDDCRIPDRKVRSMMEDRKYTAEKLIRAYSAKEIWSIERRVYEDSFNLRFKTRTEEENRKAIEEFINKEYSFDEYKDFINQTEYEEIRQLFRVWYQESPEISLSGGIFNYFSGKILERGRPDLRARWAEGEIISNLIEILTKGVEIVSEKAKYIAEKIRIFIRTRIAEDYHEPFKYISKIPSLVRRYVFDVIDDPEERDRIDTMLILPILEDLRMVGSKLLPELSKESYLRIIKAAGSKGGSEANVMMMDGFAGQQYSRGAVIPIGKGERRCLVYYNDSMDPRSRGFCSENFSQGISPAGTFHMGGAGREANITHANDTPSTGYAHRRMNRVMESYMVGREQCVIARDNIAQFLYGNDGMSPLYMTSESGYHTFLNFKKMARNFNVSQGFY
jgi:DNA-directed RNA polymerase subunit A'